jgi:diadenosine tetraphosphatase ApaH/serine/threonine PP2A family protein phosphatase
LRYGIIADIHGNLEALDAAIQVLEDREVDAYLCTGDIVGYGANPQECVDRVRELGAVVVAGNHDWAVANRLSLEFFNTYAQEAVYWTRSRLSDDNMAFLFGLPLVHEQDALTLVHSTLEPPPEMFYYLLTPYDALNSLRILEPSVGFVGHSHVPVTFFLNDQVSFSLESRIPLDRSVKAIVNTGSVGQPRDDDARAAFGLFDTEENVVEILRAEYDVETAAGKILSAGLPEVLASRLHQGK